MIRGIALGAVTTGWSTWVLPRLALSDRHNAVANLSFGIGTAVLARTLGIRPAGLRRSSWRSGLAWGAAAGAVPVVSAVVIAARPSWLERVRPSDDDLAEWILFRIPFGTVACEELVFRSVFDAASPALSPIFFGLWHIHPARTAGDSVVGTVIGTAAAGVMFSWLRRCSGSVLAPALMHLSVNVSGAVLAGTRLRN
ncbi:CPBP family intramembrane metalloprotease [Rhodococcus sp. H36-A4]|uniref:CPBP family intramembrane glutamic endopeptidase n=1 Tax=Rhodococcus sp. H36-A4 TaxID=3004353 RepID=UPI0022AEE8FD|nr:CPBP family intramembrane glutamic endopeptidase [Rhodococcus sp. H36-A4]MCZ4076724.1 CPBP family intramembrane metalloprotease [Rhodococcus sp. H36-A4]